MKRILFTVDAVVNDSNKANSLDRNPRSTPTEADLHEVAAGRDIKPPSESKEVSELIEKYERAIKKDPFNYALWTGLSNLRFNQGDLQDAISACEEGIKKYGASPSPSLALGNIYAAAGRFKLAMQCMGLFNFEESVLWLALECKDPFITPEAKDHEVNRKILLDKFNSYALALAYL